MYEDYQGSTDEELIDRLRQGEKQITDYIMIHQKIKDLFQWTSIRIWYAGKPDPCISWEQTVMI